MGPVEQFKKEQLKRIESNPKNEGLKQASDTFMRESVLSKYSYNFSWLGRPSEIRWLIGRIVNAYDPGTASAC